MLSLFEDIKDTILPHSKHEKNNSPKIKRAKKSHMIASPALKYSQHCSQSFQLFETKQCSVSP